MNTIFLALSLLSSMTGYASGYNFETTSECISDCYFEHFGHSPLSARESIVDIDDIYDMDGSNKYMLVKYNDGNSILYDKKDKTIVKTFNSDPYHGVEHNFKLVNFASEKCQFAYFDEDNNNLCYVDGTFFDQEEVRSQYTNRSFEYGHYYDMNTIPLTSGAHIISNAYYFQKLGAKHGDNTLGTCAIVSTQILLGYYDTFVSDLIVDEQFDRNAVQNRYGSNITVNRFSISPGTDDANSNINNFHDYLCDIATNTIHDDPTVNGMSVINHKKLVKQYLDDKGINYTTHTSEGNMADIISNRAKTIIKDTIDANRPVIACGEGHCTVAFAYDNDYVWVHTGWGWVGATPWRTFESGMFFNYSAGAIDIVNICNNNHVHSDNYYAPNKDLYYCPCGATYTTTDIYPGDYGIASQYNSTNSNTSFLEENVNIEINYKRVAYIENSFISLSARKANEGEAYIEYWFSHRVRKISFDISYYSYSDVLSNNNSTAVLWVLKYDTNSNSFYWHSCLDLINENISNSTNSPTRFDLNFIDEEIYGIQFETTAPATGSYDSGRVCIQNITIIRNPAAHNMF